MFILSLVWLGLGLVIGALALAARLRPSSWGRRGWLLLLGVGMLGALLGGWLGALLLGKLFGTPMAVWVAILAVFVSWLVERLRSRRKAPAPGQ
jgi:uncharacterized membrane protein YeaQ/YmgE (transglycosylase-associated protein family)